MKKISFILSFSLIFLAVLMPVGVPTAAYFGYNFELISVPVFAFILMLLTVCTVVFSFFAKEEMAGKTVSTILAIFAPLSLSSSAFYVFECSSVRVGICNFLCVGCGHYLAIRHGKPWILKMIALSVSAVLVIPKLG